MFKDKNTKKAFFLILKVVGVVIFSITFMKFVESQNKPIEVVGFKRNIEEGVKITKEDLQILETSPKLFTNSMIRSGEYVDYVGKYTTTKVFNNSIAYKQQFDDMNISEGLSSLDLSNSRVISLPIDMVEAFAGDIKRGDTVDLMFKGSGTVEDKVAEETSNFKYAKIFMQDIPVFQVNSGSGYKFIGRAHSVPGEKYTDEDEEGGEVAAEDIASISLVVTPEQAEQIEARRLTGEIKFVKRFKESETHETLGFVIGNYGKIFIGNANAETNSLQVIDNYKDNAGLTSDEDEEDIEIEEIEKIDEKEKKN